MARCERGVSALTDCGSDLHTRPHTALHQTGAGGSVGAGW